jgi:hypothetical protein
VTDMTLFSELVDKLLADESSVDRGNGPEDDYWPYDNRDEAYMARAEARRNLAAYVGFLKQVAENAMGADWVDEQLHKVVFGEDSESI